jgi:hypothetical protein
MARNQNHKNRNNPHRPNIWGFLTTVLMGGLNKGQLFGMAIVVIFIIFAIRIPSEDIIILLRNIVNTSKINSILGWILSIFTTFGGFFIIRWQRRIHTKEVQRISNEKKLLQEKLAKKELSSSNDKK